MGGGGVVRTVAKAAASVGYRAGHTPLGQAWEADQWEFAGGEEEALFGTLHLSPPSLEESREAASDLKEALRGLYSPRVNTVFERPAVESRSASSESFCLENSDAKKGCAAVLSPAPRHIIQSFSLPPSAPRHIVQAFSLLQESHEVQNIVASLAADRKVWDAVMKNEKVLKFCKTHKISSSECGEESAMNESDQENMSSPVDEGSPQSSEKGLSDYVHAIKLKVREMVDSLSDLFENFMGTTGTPGSTTTTTIIRTSTSTSTSDRGFENMAVGASLVALTIATIILMILKRADK